ncbi:hypothetical protein MKX03_026970 [Papaver bracteatum]|nr:hypothetical protein MKX03_026970 [Papaver bracteatum]
MSGGIDQPDWPANKVKKTFLKFLKQKDHKIWQSNLLFANAGFKLIFLGTLKPKTSSSKMKRIRAAEVPETHGSRGKAMSSILKEFKEQCATPIGKLRQVADAMTVEMHAGLASEGGSKLKMLNSHVIHLPTDDEHGLFYALYLGGTNFHVLRVQLGGRDGSVVKKEFTEVSIPPELMIVVYPLVITMTTTSSEIFDFIAKELARFIATEGQGFFLPPCCHMELGFTFSFPVKQLSIAYGTLIRWTKGLSIDDAVDKDVVVELTKALDRQGIDMHVAALVNDTIGTLAGDKYFNNDVAAASVHMPFLNQEVINIEWGNFRSSHLPVTEYDEALDQENLNVGEQIFENMISGMYLGDIVRRVLSKMAEEAGFFVDTVPPKLKTRFILKSPEICAMHHDTSRDLIVVGSKLNDIFWISDTYFETRRVVVELCNIVATHVARLSAAGILGILKKMGKDTVNEGEKQRTVIAVDGGLFEHYTEFRCCLESTVNELLGDEFAHTVVIEHANDSYGIGAALLASSHSQYPQV